MGVCNPNTVEHHYPLHKNLAVLTRWVGQRGFDKRKWLGFWRDGTRKAVVITRWPWDGILLCHTSWRCNREGCPPHSGRGTPVGGRTHARKTQGNYGRRKTRLTSNKAIVRTFETFRCQVRVSAFTAVSLYHVETFRQIWKWDGIFRKTAASDGQSYDPGQKLLGHFAFSAEFIAALTLSLLSSKCTFSNHVLKLMYKRGRIGSIIIFHLSKLWKAKFVILCDVLFLVRL